MASRAELKDRAKACLKKYYWMALLVSVIASLLGAGQSFSLNLNVNNQNHTGDKTIYNGDIDHSAYLTVLVVILVIAIIAFIISLAIQTFLSNVVQMGLCSYFVESSKNQADAGFSRLFYGFNCGNYMNVVKTMFMKNLIVFGWWLLLVIPGIIKSYEYAMVPYILAEHPDMEYRTALSKSREMMDGHKWDFFVLQLSFIGWEMLGILMCCIGIIFVMPYEYATFAEFYLNISRKPLLL